MDSNERIQMMEEELAANRMKTDAIENALKAIMTKLQIPDPEGPTTEGGSDFRHPENPKTPKNTTPGLSKVKPAAPMDFDGDREKGRAFLNSCNIYFMICGDLFPNEQARIHWALSFFKADRAARFSNKVLRMEAKGRGPYFSDWSAFSETFMDLFCPKNEQLTALTKLEGTGWYQARDSVEEYIDRFQELIDIAEYDDDKTIVIKFRKGLDPAIQNKVALLGDGTPDFDDPEGWYAAARKVARNREANEAFVESNKNALRTSTRPPNSAPRLVPGPTLQSGVPRKDRSLYVPFRASGPTLPHPRDGPEPMDVDRTRSQGNFPMTCRRCNKPGHYARECPHAFDVRTMTLQEKLELIPELLALADVSRVPSSELDSEEDLGVVPEEEDKEGFGNSSR
jgi:hypothetical protein